MPIRYSQGKKMQDESVEFLSLNNELLLKIVDSMTTTEWGGLLLSCRRLSNLMRPSVFHKRQTEACYQRSECLAVVWA